MTCTVLKEKRFLKVVTSKTIFAWPLAQITFKKISYHLSRIFKLVTHIFKKKFTSCWTGKYKLYKIPWHLRRSDASNKTLNKKDETQVNIKDLDAAIMFSTNVMNEQTENNKQTNCFLKIFIRKLISLTLKAIHVTLTGSSGSVATSKISWPHGKN